jgi:hypothetical protein
MFYGICAVVGEHRSDLEAIPEGVVEFLRELMPI